MRGRAGWWLVGRRMWTGVRLARVLGHDERGEEAGERKRLSPLNSQVDASARSLMTFPRLQGTYRHAMWTTVSTRSTQSGGCARALCESTATTATT